MVCHESPEVLKPVTDVVLNTKTNKYVGGKFTYALQQQSRSTDRRRAPATRLLLRWVPFLEVRAAMLSEGVLTPE